MYQNLKSIDLELIKAKKFVSKGDVASAKGIWNSILERHPNNLRVKKELLKIKDNQNSRSTLNLNKIIKLYQQKKFKEALAIGKVLFNSNPNDFTLCNVLGAIYSMLLDPNMAIKFYEKSIKINPHFAASYSNLGACYRGMKNYPLAIENYNKAIEINPSFCEAYNNLGLVYKDLEDFQNSIKFFESAIIINKKYVSAHNNLGLMYQKVKKFNEALHCFDKAIRLQTNYFEAYTNRGNVKVDLGSFESALVDFNFALEMQPNSAETYNCMGSCYQNMGKLQTARKNFKKAIDINPNFSDAYNNLAVVSEYLMDHENAIIFFKKAIELNDNNHNAKTFLSYHYFLAGDYEKFQQFYKSRLIRRGDLNHVPLGIAKPYYEISDIINKKIVVYDEQGIGDEINFVGFLEEFKKTISKNITLVCSNRLKNLYKNSFPLIPIYTREELDPQKDKFDCEMPVGSLLEYTSLDQNKNLPFKSYIKPSNLLCSFWQKELNNLVPGKKIGIAWKGGMTPGQQLKRSIDLVSLMRHLPKDGNYINLQYGAHEPEIEEAELKTGRKIIHFADINPLNEVDNSLSIMSNLDHIITIQNSTYHFAGSLGIPTTALLSVSPDFRYGSKNTESIFYNSVKFIRQTNYGEWDNVLKKLEKQYINFFKN